VTDCGSVRKCSGCLDVRVAVWKSLASFEWERARLRRALWLGVPLALLVASIGGWIVGDRGLRPLAETARQAEAILRISMKAGIELL
jgi:hypothetical protein